MNNEGQLPALKKKLKVWGADPETAIAGVLGDETLYYNLLLELARGEDLERLTQEIDREHYRDAFAIAHSLKGSTSTLGLVPLYAAVSALTEDTRDIDHVRPQLNRDRQIFEIERKLFLDMMQGQT